MATWPFFGSRYSGATLNLCFIGPKSYAEINLLADAYSPLLSRTQPACVANRAIKTQKGIFRSPDEAIRRSRRGLASKVHPSCDGKGRPLSVVVTAGQRHESTQLETILDAIRVSRLPGAAGRPRKRPEHLIADKSYSYPSCRRLLRGRGIRHTIPERRDERERRMRRPGRPLSFDATTCARRNVVERCVNRLEQWRGIATRYEKRALNYRAAVFIAALMIWLAS